MDNQELQTKTAAELVDIAVDVIKALKPFALFGKYIVEHPQPRGLDNDLYGWDGGVGPAQDAVVRQSDLRTAYQEYNKALAALDGLATRLKTEAAKQGKELPHG